MVLGMVLVALGVLILAALIVAALIAAGWISAAIIRELLQDPLINFLVRAASSLLLVVLFAGGLIVTGLALLVR